MERNTIIGIDLAKSVMHAVVMNDKCRVIERKRMSRGQLLRWLAGKDASLIGIEACGGSNYWAREIQKLCSGSMVKIISPQHVIPYRKSQKNDYNDAEAIAEAVQKDNMRFVDIKDEEQLTIQLVLRHRELLAGQKTQLINQIHGFFLEFGIYINKGRASLRKLAEILWKNRDKLNFTMIRLISDKYREILRVEQEICKVEKELELKLNKNPKYQKLQKIPAIGKITAATLLAMCANPCSYKNGRSFAASLGLVPRQHSTGGKARLGGITKRGNKTLRSLLAICAQSVLHSRRKHHDKLTRWAFALLKTKHRSVAVIAVANKLARIAWKILKFDCDYDYDAQFQTVTA